MSTADAAALSTAEAAAASSAKDVATSPAEDIATPPVAVIVMASFAAAASESLLIHVCSSWRCRRNRSAFLDAALCRKNQNRRLLPMLNSTLWFVRRA